MNVKAILCFLSFYGININSSFFEDQNRKLKIYSTINPDYYKILKKQSKDMEYFNALKKNDSSPIAKDRASIELLKKVKLVFDYINRFEGNIADFIEEKILYHKFMAKITPAKRSKETNSFINSDEESYKRMGYDTTLTEDQLAFIIQWFNERYEAIKDKPYNQDVIKFWEEYDAQENARKRFEMLNNAIKSYKSLKNQDYLKNWHPYQGYWNKKYKISDFEKGLLDSNPFL